MVSILTRRKSIDKSLVSLIQTEEGSIKRKALNQLYSFYLSYYTDYFHQLEPPIGNHKCTKESIEDAVSIGMQKAFSKLGDFQSENKKFNFSGWLYIIIVNSIIDIIRKEVKMDLTELSDYVPKVVQTKFYSNISLKGVEKHIEKIIDNIPNKSHSKVLRLRFVDNLKYDEISKKLKLSMPTVKTIINRGKRKITKELKSIGIDKQIYFN